jgi:alkylhydroperoxidase/carboxymuconolactone decarboxylase family protein YurZ
MASRPDREQLKQHFDSQLGPDASHEGWSSLLRTNPIFFTASLHLASVPRRKAHLSRKDQALIGLAVDCAATHLYQPGIRAHVAAAAREGASVDEVLEVIELSSTLGIHACNIGVPLLVEVLKEEGLFTEDITRPFDDNQERLKREFTERRGYWHTSGRTSSGSIRSSLRPISSSRVCHGVRTWRGVDFQAKGCWSQRYVYDGGKEIRSDSRSGFGRLLTLPDR